MRQYRTGAGGAAAGVLAAGLLVFGMLAPVGAQTAGTERSAKTWIGQEAALEECLRTAEILEMTDIGVGVTNPKKATLAEDGLCEAMAWKPIRPGLYRGFWESYRSEIAAYEIDKLLGLGMVPPTVERRVRGDLGAAILWVSPTKSFAETGEGGAPSPPPQLFESWNRQMMRAKMFHNLIGNIDPNLGNWLVDPAWNLILIDHTRALTTRRDMPHTLNRVDGELWDRMAALTEESLTAALGQWLGRREIRALLQRRDQMKKTIEKMVAERGETAVFARDH
jgi:hypothetical protein